ncbi:MAG: Flp1 family type IVb pilin [Acutalibacteraceae bacterium]
MLKKMMLTKAWLGNKVSNFMSNERGDVNVVSIVVLIGIAIVLALLFKNAIGGLLNTLLGTIKTKAGNAVAGT